MDTDSLSITAPFLRPGNPHDVMGFTDAGIMERRMMRHHVAEILEIAAARPHARMVLDLSRFYLMRVSLLVSMYLSSRIICVGDNVSDPCLRQYLNDDDLLITDRFRGFSGNDNSIDISTTLTFSSAPEKDEQILSSRKIGDISGICFALFGGDTGVSVQEYPVSLNVMEQQCRDQIREIPEIAEAGVAVSTFPPTHGFGFSHSLLMSMMLDLPMFDRALRQDSQVSLLGLPEYALFTSPEFLNSLNIGDVFPNCKLVLVNGFFEKMMNYIAANSIMDCPIIESLGTLAHGVIALRRLSHGKSFRFVNNVVYRLDEDGVLICNSYFDSERCSYPTEYVVNVTGREFVITGRRKRLVTCRGKSWNLDDMENTLERAGFGSRAAVFEYVPWKEKERYVVIAVESEELCALSASSDIENRGLAADYVNEIRNELSSGGYPSELLPRKVRFVRKISYNEFGRPDYERLKKLFD
ncbi:MAG: hypothetical protein II922_11065 [Succinimonas sp.]|nr:hypothetical protein [Succinimonas sp.]